MEPKKFLFVSNDALSIDSAWRIFKEGHDVKYYVGEASERDIGNGFVQKVDDWNKEVDWADIIVFDDVLGFGTPAKRLRDNGKLVIGGTPYTDMLEDGRAFGQEELKKLKVPILNYQGFSDFDEAIAFVQNNPGKYVIKPDGEAQNYKRLLFVGEEDDGSDVIRVLEAYKKVWSKILKVFQLQKRVQGVEVAVGAFFNGKKFLYPININFEHKKLFPGNIGPSTGEMGTSMFWSEPNRLFNATLQKFESVLAAEKYVGYIDLNCIVNAVGIYPLEFTARFGYPTIQIQSESLTMPLSEFFYRMAAGDDFEIKVKKGFQVGVQVVVPPFPYKEQKVFDAYSKDATIVFKKKNYDGVHIEDVKIINDEWIVAGSSGVVLVVVGSGTSMRQAQTQAYNRIQNILIPNMYYRKDIGDRWSDDSDRLHTWGYLRSS
ncbi:phosphoribosylamine--glycine ligase [bacterium]|nr:phosphoribosylamine--glycine ligase [bacterium]